MDPIVAVVRCLAMKTWRTKATDTQPEKAFTTFLASSDVEDRYGDVVAQDSWRLANYKKNPIILVDHYYSVEAIVGRATEMKVAPIEGAAEGAGQNGLYLTVEWDLGCALGVEVAGKAERGFVNAGSVGFRSYKMTRRSGLPKDHAMYSAEGYLLEENDLYEFSIVAVPANQEAIAQRAARAAGVDVASVVRTTLEQLVTDDQLWRSVEARRLAATASSTPTAEDEEDLPWLRGEAPAPGAADYRPPWT